MCIVADKELLNSENTDVFTLPFDYFICNPAFPVQLSLDLLEWLENDAPWKLVVTEFYEQYEFSFFDINLPSKISFLTSPDYLSKMRSRVEKLFSVKLKMHFDFTAHKLVSGQHIGIHNDYIPNCETHRLLIQLNRGWEDENGGMLIFFNSRNANDIHKIFRPIHNSSVGFSISPSSNHAVSKIHKGERFTIVYSFYQKKMNDIHNLIFSTIENSSTPAWFPILTKHLVNDAWKTIYQKYGIQENSYSTEAILHSNINNSIVTTAHLSLTAHNKVKQFRSIKIYPVPETIALMYSYSGTKPYLFKMLQNSTVLQCLQESLDILSAIPTVYETISYLVACLHILQPEDDDFDISYSLPNIPFSIFVSVPSKRVKNDALRVAEAILHEAMHLQLTLIEQLVPMIIETDKSYFSPWKNEYRNPRGVLHAIHVFCVIKNFFELLVKQNTSNLTIHFLNERCNTISQQLIEVNDFLNCPYLTKAGQVLTNKHYQGLNNLFVPYPKLEL